MIGGEIVGHRRLPAGEPRAAGGAAGARASPGRRCRRPTPRRRSSASAARRAITLLSLISLPPLLNAIMMIGTRILFAMGRDGLLWSRTATVNAGGTPGVATLVTTAVAIVLIVTGTFQRLVAMASFFLAANYSVCCLALVVLRRREPELPRPFRAWGYPWSAGIVLAGAAVFLVGVSGRRHGQRRGGAGSAGGRSRRPRCIRAARVRTVSGRGRSSDRGPQRGNCVGVETGPALERPQRPFPTSISFAAAVAFSCERSSPCAPQSLPCESEYWLDVSWPCAWPAPPSACAPAARANESLHSRARRPVPLARWERGRGRRRAGAARSTTPRTVHADA